MQAGLRKLINIRSTFMKEKADKYFELKKEKFKVEEQEDDLKRSQKMIKDLSQSSNEYMADLRQIKDSENDILGSDYANEITSINDELMADSKVLNSLIGKLNKAVDSKLKNNYERQDEITKELLSKEKKETRHD